MQSELCDRFPIAVSAALLCLSLAPDHSSGQLKFPKIPAHRRAAAFLHRHVCVLCVVRVFFNHTLHNWMLTRTPGIHVRLQFCQKVDGVLSINEQRTKIYPVQYLE